MSMESNLSRRRNVAREESSTQYVETRRRVVEAAAEVFRERGFDNTNLQDIAAALGMKRATLYYYVDSKESIFREVILEAVRGNVRAIQRISGSKAPATDKIDAVIRGLMTSYEENYPHLYVYIQEEMERVLVHRGPQQRDARERAVNDEIFEHNRTYLAALESIMREGIRDGAFVDDDPRLMALAIQGMVNWTHRWFKPGGRFTAAEVAGTFSRIAVSGLTSESLPPNPSAPPRQPGG
jgi:AcrR family transcriptional regulator